MNPWPRRASRCPPSPGRSPRSAIVLGVLPALDLASAGPLHSELTGRGIAVSVAQVRLAQLLDWMVWAALLPIIFRVLDRILPLRRATWYRHLPAWLAAAIGFGALHAALSVPLIHAVATIFAVPADAIVVPALRLGQMVRDDIDNFTIAVLAYLPLQVLHRNRAERDRARELERSLREARLHSLALELQPHFLFNTLNGIAALVRSEPRAAEQMLVKLSDLLRLTLDAGTDGCSRWPRSCAAWALPRAAADAPRRPPPGAGGATGARRGPGPRHAAPAPRGECHLPRHRCAPRSRHPVAGGRARRRGTGPHARG